MVYTLTLNPSIDYVMYCGTLTRGAINRSTRELFVSGGKGINVSKIMKELGHESTCLGFVAGFTGDEIEKELRDEKIRTDFVHLPAGASRICVKLRPDDDPGETDINAAGPAIDPQSIDKLMEQLSELKKDDFLILSGSLPKTLPPDFYAAILAVTAKNHVPFAVDTEGDALLGTLPYHPFLIKPNEDELASIFGNNPEDDGEILACAQKLQAKGAENVLVSLGRRGALLLTKDGKVYRKNAAKIRVVDTVGAGDSMLAAFLCSYFDTGDPEEALRTGIAAGAASAETPLLARRARILALRNSLS